VKPNKPRDLWRYVDVRRAKECWPYSGLMFCNGYGRFNMNQTSYVAHRVAYELEHGPVPDGLLVMHKCNNKACCNPSHLTVGTNSDNQIHASMSGAHKAGQTGIRGVSKDRKRGYWTAQAYKDGKKQNLYTGPHKQKAIDARARWERDNGITFEESR
jgi:hypothetical protein